MADDGATPPVGDEEEEEGGRSGVEVEEPVAALAPTSSSSAAVASSMEMEESLLTKWENMMQPLTMGLSVMPDILREHTKEIRALRADLAALNVKADTIAKDARGNQDGLKEFQSSIDHVLNSFRTELGKNAVAVAEVRQTNAGFAAMVDELSSRIEDFPAIKAETIRQKEQVDQMAGKMEMLSAEMAFFLKSSTDQFASLEEKSTEFDTQLSALRKHVDGLADALVLSANQITVAASAGFASKPMNLFEILKLCNTSIMSLQGITSEHSNQIADNVKSTAKKADETVIIDINNHDARLGEIEDRLKKDEEDGVNALRKSCRQLADMVEHLKFDLDDKVDVRSVDAIVHRKYEEIVHYLKDALSATQEDEANFKEKVEEFQRTVQRLSITKVDRSEIATMQEFIVTAEATLKKLTKDKENSKEVFTKEELAPILESKLNKAEYEEGYDSLMKVVKKTRKLAALSGSQGEAADMATDMDALKKRLPLLSSTSLGLLSKGQDKPNRAATAAPSSANFAAYALREKQVRMQLQTAATIVSLPPGHGSSGGGEFGDGMDGVTRFPDASRPRTTLPSPGAKTPLKGAMRQHTSTPGSGPGASPVYDRGLLGSAERSRYASPPRMAGEADLAFLGAQVAGAGYNLRSTSPIPHEPLVDLVKHAVDFTDPDVDIMHTRERGDDGRFYFTE